MAADLAQDVQTLPPEVRRQAIQYLINGMRRLESKSAGRLGESLVRYLVHYVDEGLGVVPTEVANRLNLVVVR